MAGRAIVVIVAPVLAADEYRQPLAGPHELLRCATTGQQPPQEQRIDATAKTLLAVDHHDGHACGVASLQLGVGIDIERLELQPVLAQHLGGFVTQMAPCAGIQADVRHGIDSPFRNEKRLLARDFLGILAHAGHFSPTIGTTKLRARPIAHLHAIATYNNTRLGSRTLATRGVIGLASGLLSSNIVAAARCSVLAADQGVSIAPLAAGRVGST